MNSWNFTGNLGGDAELRFTKAGTEVLQFTVATTAGYGERKATSWARCTLFGKRADSLAPYLVKGQQVAITGEVKLHEWTNKAGETKQSLEVNVQDVTLIGGKPAAGEPAARAKPAEPVRQEAADFADDDIPF
jgi:single-strand DNA-binding protein